MNSNATSSQSIEQGNTQSAAFDYQGWREQFILTVLRIACILGIALIVASYTPATPAERILFISLYGILVAITVLPVPYRIRALTLLGLNFAIGIYTIVNWGVWSDGSLFLLVTVVLSSLFFSRRIDIVVLVTNIFTVLLIATLQQMDVFSLIDARAPTLKFDDWAFFIIDFSIAGILIVVALGRFREEFTRVIHEMQSTFKTLIAERTQLEDGVRERTEELETQTKQLRTSASVARIVAEIQNITELMETVTSLISERFEYYQVGLYILDEHKKIAFLQSASSVTGKQLIGQGFRVEPDRRNAINMVVEQNRPNISSDVGNPNFVRDANFPLTRSRMILPLAVRGNVLGVLDIHSDQPQAFDIQDAEILQTLSDLVAISFDNVRLINETKNLVNQLELNTSFQTGETWSKLTSRRKSAYQYTPAGVRPVFSTDTQDADGLRVPLILYGQNIGFIKLKRKGGAREWSKRERTLIDRIADQAALALENSRLVDEAQKSALRDQMIANISNRVRETLDVESVVRTAATELRRVFDLKEAEISIGSPHADAAPVRKNTGSLRLKS